MPNANFVKMMFVVVMIILDRRRNRRHQTPIPVRLCLSLSILSCDKSVLSLVSHFEYTSFTFRLAIRLVRNVKRIYSAIMCKDDVTHKTAEVGLQCRNAVRGIPSHGQLENSVKCRHHFDS